MNRNVVQKVNHNEYKDLMLNNKSMTHSIYRIQIKNHIIGTYKINKSHYLILTTKYISKTMDMMD